MEARELADGRAAILSKIEKLSAVQHFRNLNVSDGIMVARGDLGVELPVQNVPLIQKRLVLRCREVAKPVIVATEKWESMIESPMSRALKFQTLPMRFMRVRMQSCCRRNLLRVILSRLSRL